MEETCDFWVHEETGKVFAVRHRGECVTGCVGPLDFRTFVAHDDPAAFHYDDKSLTAAWIEEHRLEFMTAREWLRGKA